MPRCKYLLNDGSGNQCNEGFWGSNNFCELHKCPTELCPNSKPSGQEKCSSCIENPEREEQLRTDQETDIRLLQQQEQLLQQRCKHRSDVNGQCLATNTEGSRFCGSHKCPTKSCLNSKPSQKAKCDSCSKLTDSSRGGYKKKTKKHSKNRKRQTKQKNTFKKRHFLKKNTFKKSVGKKHSKNKKSVGKKGKKSKTGKKHKKNPLKKTKTPKKHIK